MAPPTETEKSALKEFLLGRLASTPFACSSLVELTNGTTNFVFRGQLERQQGEDTQLQTVIVKHTTGYAAANKDFAIDASRSTFEEAMLGALNTFQPSQSQSKSGQQVFSAQAPRLLWFDRATNAQVLQDFADAVDLKTVLLASAAETDTQQHPLQDNAHSIGFALGQWLRSFHAWTSAPEQSALRETIAANEPMRRLKHQITYDALVRIVSQFDIAEDDLAVLKEVQAAAAQDFGSVPDTSTPNWGIVHCDFWSGNVLVPSDLAERRLFVVDWEFAQLGHRAYDVGQMVGDLLEREHFRGATAALDILRGFVSGYGLGLQDGDLFYRTAIHAGVHLVCCMIRRAPTGPLPGSPEQVEQAIKLGVDLIVRGWAQDEVWFKTSSVFAGVM